MRYCLDRFSTLMTDEDIAMKKLFYYQRKFNRSIIIIFTVKARLC
jgi:hypothetical protein